MSRRRRRGHGPSFLQLHNYIFDCPAYRSLSLAGRAALNELIRIYNGRNNGCLAMSVRMLAERLNSSKDTASRALTELEEKGFIETTKVGSFRLKQRYASEYRLTWHRDDNNYALPTKAFMRWRPASCRSDAAE
jgi:DNA-binding Lrp family transcriptional regulator